MLIGVLFAVPMALRVHLFEIDSRVLGGMVWVAARAHFCLLTVEVLWDAVCGELFEVLVTARAHFCEIDARVLSSVQVTVQAHVCILTVGGKGACSLGGGLGFCLGCWLIFARLTAALQGDGAGAFLLD